VADASEKVLDIDERPALGAWILLSLQHLFAMFGATILVPILITGQIRAADPEMAGLAVAVALFTSGSGTLLYIAITGGRVPAYLGSSFAFIAPIAAAAAVGGLEGALFGAFCAGLVYLIVAALIWAFGVGWLIRLLPPVVVGPVIMVIGLGLAPIAIDMASTGGSGEYAAVNLLVAAVTLGFVLLFAIVLTGFMSVVPILLGILCGYAFAAAMGMVDFGAIAAAPAIRVPDFASFLAVIGDGVPWQVLPIVVPVAVVTIAEHIGDQIVISRIVGRNTLRNPGLHRSLAGDGLATMWAALWGGPPNTTYGENVGVLAITRVFSVWVVGGAALLAILLAFVGTLSATIDTIPVPVMGGVAIALFGVIAASGLRTLMEGEVDMNLKRNLLIPSVILVLGIGGAVLKFGPEFSVSSMALAAIVGVVLNAVLPGAESAGDTGAILGDA